MLFTISGKHMEMTSALKKHAREKTSKLPRYYDSINRIEVILDGSTGGNGGVAVEIIAKGQHGNIFVANETCQDAYKAIDIAVHKLERQLRRKKTRERNNKHVGG